jgi:hypothetical protein
MSEEEEEERRYTNRPDKCSSYKGRKVDDLIDPGFPGSASKAKSQAHDDVRLASGRRSPPGVWRCVPGTENLSVYVSTEYP